MSPTHCLFGKKLLTYFKIISLVDFDGGKGKQEGKGDVTGYRATILKAIYRVSDQLGGKSWPDQNYIL